MSDFQDISTSVVVHGAPKVEKFTPMSGQNAGKEQTVLNFRAYHPNFQRQEDGSFKMLDSDWYDVKYNGKAIEQVQGLLKDGMTLEVRGSMPERVWKRPHLSRSLRKKPGTLADAARTHGRRVSKA